MRFTECLTVEVAGQGVQTFAVDPGLVHTPLVDGALRCGVPYIEQIFQG
jgi:NAD(P)-dependent dehydrogenase (short-subunit alcohol dehydrogenase family)